MLGGLGRYELTEWLEVVVGKVGSQARITNSWRRLTAAVSPMPMSMFSKVRAASFRSAGRIVEVGDATRGEASHDAGIIRLPVTVVAFTDHRHGDRIQHSRTHGAGSLVEIAWILFEERREDSASDKGAGDQVGVCCAIAFAVALRALTVPRKGVRGLLDAGDDAGYSEGDWIDRGFPGELEFLLARERSRMRDVADVEIRDNAE